MFARRARQDGPMAKFSGTSGRCPGCSASISSISIRLPRLPGVVCLCLDSTSGRERREGPRKNAPAVRRKRGGTFAPSHCRPVVPLVFVALARHSCRTSDIFSPMRLSAAMVYVKDLPRMRAFYGEMLGVKPINETWTDSWTEFDAGGVLFALHAIPPEIASQIEITSPPRPRGQNPVKLL